MESAQSFEKAVSGSCRVARDWHSTVMLGISTAKYRDITRQIVILDISRWITSRKGMLKHSAPCFDFVLPICVKSVYQAYRFSIATSASKGVSKMMVSSPVQHTIHVTMFAVLAHDRDVSKGQYNNRSNSTLATECDDVRCYISSATRTFFHSLQETRLFPALTP